jgi:hypothetical protein
MILDMVGSEDGERAERSAHITVDGVNAGPSTGFERVWLVAERQPRYDGRNRESSSSDE